MASYLLSKLEAMVTRFWPGIICGDFRAILFLANFFNR